MRKNSRSYSSRSNVICNKSPTVHRLNNKESVSKRKDNFFSLVWKKLTSFLFSPKSEEPEKREVSIINGSERLMNLYYIDFKDKKKMEVVQTVCTECLNISFEEGYIQQLSIEDFINTLGATISNKEYTRPSSVRTKHLKSIRLKRCVIAKDKSMARLYFKSSEMGDDFCAMLFVSTEPKSIVIDEIESQPSVALLVTSDMYDKLIFEEKHIIGETIKLTCGLTSQPPEIEEPAEDDDIDIVVEEYEPKPEVAVEQEEATEGPVNPTTMNTEEEPESQSEPKVSSFLARFRKNIGTNPLMAHPNTKKEEPKKVVESSNVSPLNKYPSVKPEIVDEAIPQPKIVKTVPKQAMVEETAEPIIDNGVVVPDTNAPIVTESIPNKVGINGMIDRLKEDNKFLNDPTYYNKMYELMANGVQPATALSMLIGQAMDSGNYIKDIDQMIDFNGEDKVVKVKLKDPTYERMKSKEKMIAAAAGLKNGNQFHQ